MWKEKYILFLSSLNIDIYFYQLFLIDINCNIFPSFYIFGSVFYIVLILYLVFFYSRSLGNGSRGLWVGVWIY